MPSPVEPAFSLLVPQAEALAGRRHEQFSALHLLVALGASQSATAAMLDAFGAGPRRVLDQWERNVEHGPGENLLQLSGLVRDSARRFGSPTPTAPHLLLVLINDSKGSARRTLDALGIDLAGLRSRTVELVQGLSERALTVQKSSLSEARRELLLSRRSLPIPAAPAPSGVVVPVMPTEPVRGPYKPWQLKQAEASINRDSGQALPFVPQVGPTPFPGQRLSSRRSTPPSAGPLALQSPPPPQAASPLPAPVGASSESPAPLRELDRTFLAERFGLSKKAFPILTTIGKNLSWLAVSEESDPVVGRQTEIEQALDVLAKRQGNNPCLIGPAGVGKTAIARGIAAAIAAREDAERADPRLVIEIPIAELVAGTGVRGALASRLGQLKKEVQAAQGRVVLFFDEIHQLFSGDAADELAGDLKLALSRGELPCIGATTVEEFRRVIERDPALARRFTPIEIDEPSREDAYLVLSSVAEKLERHHGVSYDEEALALTVAWSVRYLPGRCLPDKAVSVIDLAGARSRRRGKRVVGPEAVAEVIAGQAGLPIERLLESDADRMLKLEEILAERVIGHEPQIHKIARILRRNAAGLGSRRPIGTFLLLGPTGVGKTETAKAIAEVLFHSESAMTRIDMGEMSEAHAVAKLVGSPPGYVGHDAGGQLTEAVRRRPYQVVLLDEIEKAHPEVLTAFLAVFDEGRMTDSRGRLVDFTNAVIVLTSNLGASETAAVPKKRVGFSTGAVVDDGVNDRVVGAARRALPPELYNRIDEVLCFSPLSRDDVRRIGRKLVDSLAREVARNRGIRLVVEEGAIEVLLDQGGFDAELGARPLRRTLARRVEAPLAEAILSQTVVSGEEYRVRAAHGELVFDVPRASSAAE